MSKFYDFISSSDSDSEDSEEKQVVELKGQKISKNNFSSDSEDEKRVVKSNKEKKYEELQKIVKDLKNHKNIKDLTKVLQDYELLIKCFEKVKKSMDKDVIEKFYIRIIAELEDFVDNCWTNKKDLNKNNAKSLTSLRQKVKKYNKDFESQICDFRQNGENYPSELVEVEEPKEEKKVDNDDDEEEDDVEWDDSSSESSSDDNVEYQNPADRFLKSNTSKHDDKKKKERKEKEVKEPKKKALIDDQEWTVVENNKNKIFAAGEEITIENVLIKLHKEIESRKSLKDSKRTEIDVVEQLYNIAVEHKLGLGLQLKIKLVTMTGLLGYKCNSSNPCMQYDHWTKTMKLFIDILEILESNIGTISFEISQMEEDNLVIAPFTLNGCIISIFQQINAEYSKILVNHDFNDSEQTSYVKKLQSENELVLVCDRLSAYIDKNDYPCDKKCVIYRIRLNNLYYRVDSACLAVDNSVEYQTSTTYKLICSLISFITKYDSEKDNRHQAILCYVYFLALHDHYRDAVNMFIGSEISRGIEGSNIATQVLFNRVTVQLGLCAFKQGLIKEAHEALQEIQGSGRIKELLAQNVRNVDKRVEISISADELYRERLRLLPYHKHISTDVVEGVYLICAMLIAVPVAHKDNKPIMSKNLHYVLKNSDRLTVVGPPETIKDHVVAACKALFVGDWENVVKKIFNEKMFKSFWRRFGSKYEQLKEEITNKIKIEAVKVYISINCDNYEFLSLSYLAETFQVASEQIKSVVAKMILSQSLEASLDDQSQCIMMHKMSTSSLMAAALKLSDKIAVLHEMNDKLTRAKMNYDVSKYKDVTK